MRFLKNTLALLLAALLAVAPSQAQYPLNPYAPTYQARATTTMPVTTSFDFACIEGPSSGSARILQIGLQVLAGSASGSHYALLFFRSALTTGGTSTTASWVPRDSGDAAATFTLRTWTVGGSTGAGTLFDGQLFWIQAGTTTTPSNYTLFDYTTSGKLLTLHGPNEAVCIQTPDNISTAVIAINVIAQQG